MGDNMLSSTRKEVAQALIDADGSITALVSNDLKDWSKVFVDFVVFDHFKSPFATKDDSGEYVYFKYCLIKNELRNPEEKKWTNPWAKYRSVDSDGELYEFSEKPYVDGASWISDFGNIGFVSHGHDPTNWKESMEERPKKMRQMTQRENALFIMDGKKAMKKKSWCDHDWTIGFAWGSDARMQEWQWADLEDPNFPQWRDFPMVEEK